MAIIHDAVQAGRGAPLPRDWHKFDGRRGTKTIEELARERRAMFPQPIRKQPLAVDIIRADRDRG